MHEKKKCVSLQHIISFPNHAQLVAANMIPYCFQGFHLFPPLPSCTLCMCSASHFHLTNGVFEWALLKLHFSVSRNTCNQARLRITLSYTEAQVCQHNPVAVQCSDVDTVWLCQNSEFLCCTPHLIAMRMIIRKWGGMQINKELRFHTLQISKLLVSHILTGFLPQFQLMKEKLLTLAGH